MKTIKIIIADDHKIFRDGLAFALNTIDNVKVIAQAENGIQLLELLKKNDVDIIFMDVDMPKMGGMDASRQIKEIKNGIKIIGISSFDEIHIIKDSLNSGMDAYLLKNVDYVEIKEAISKVLNNEVFFSKKILEIVTNDTLNLIKKVKSEKELEKLTKRELEIIKHLHKGLNSSDIAEILFISKRTVDKHKQNIMSKLKVKSTTELIVFINKNNLL